MAKFIRIDRRILLARLGKGALALAVVGACADEALATVGEIAGLDFVTLYFGHGEQVLEDASRLGR